jgi:hypothetical protein
MRRDRAGSAIAARDAGLRRVTRLTWQLAAAGAVCSALIAAAFGHGTSQHGTSQHGTSQHGTSQHGTSQHGAGQQSTGQQSTGRTGATQHGTGHHRAKHPGSGLVIPSQPPAPAPGDGQVTSGGS